MKYLLPSLLLFLNLPSFSQTKDTLENNPGKTTDSISFISKIDINRATKDGIYLGGYVVNIDYDEIQKLNGKKVRISGRVAIVRGLKNSPKNYDKEGRELIRQGREDDTKYIDSPIIEIIKG